MGLDADPPIGLLIALARKQISRAVTLQLESSGTTPQQFWVMLLIREGVIERVQDVGRRIGIDKPATSRLVDQLEQRRWVRLARVAPDRRQIAIGLTAAGRRKAVRFSSMANALSRQIERGLDSNEKALLARLLRHVIANLASEAGEPRHTAAHR